jgi:uncharacterized protein YbbC (DUF1343 family)
MTSLASPVELGLEQLLRSRPELLAGRRVGLLCNPTSVDTELRHASALLPAAGARLEAIFGPEHGVLGTAQDMIAVEADGDSSGPPVYSLYGATEQTLTPRADWLEGLDAVVIDLQDIGARYYTYVWTAALMSKACAEAGVQVIVCDRPNPLGGVAIEGPSIEAGFESFVGLHPVPVRHGLTIGELCKLYAAERRLDVDLLVLEARGWGREQRFDQLGLPWVLPSPNMPTLDTAWVYPGGCLLEGTNASEGRGTTRPFEIIGAPYVDPERWSAALAAEGLAGVRFRALSFEPTFQKHARTPCGGVQLHVTDRSSFAPLRVGVALLATLQRCCAGAFGWRAEAYEFVADRPAIDLLAGGRWLREGVEAGVSVDELCAGWPAAEAVFAERRRPFLLYPEPA